MSDVIPKSVVAAAMITSMFGICAIHDRFLSGNGKTRKTVVKLESALEAHRKRLDLHENDIKTLTTSVLKKMDNLSGIKEDIAELKALISNPKNLPEADALVVPSPSRFQRLMTEMKWRLREGQGEAIYVIGMEDDGDDGLTDREMDAYLSTLKRVALELGASVTILREREVGDVSLRRRVAEVLVRKIPDSQQKSLNVRIVQNVSKRTKWTARFLDRFLNNELNDFKPLEAMKILIDLIEEQKVALHNTNVYYVRLLQAAIFANGSGRYGNSLEIPSGSYGLHACLLSEKSSGFILPHFKYLNILVQIEQTPEAKSYLNEALEMLTFVLGTDHSMTKQALEWLAVCQSHFDTSA